MEMDATVRITSADFCHLRKTAKVVRMACGRGRWKQARVRRHTDSDSFIICGTWATPDIHWFVTLKHIGPVTTMLIEAAGRTDRHYRVHDIDHAPHLCRITEQEYFGMSKKRRTRE